MAKDLLRLRRIYDRTDGRCHLCHCKLSFKNHGKRGARGAWHIEHSKARANGGSDHGNNLFAACIDCNLDKGILTSRTARKRSGTTRAPYSKSRKERFVKITRQRELFSVAFLVQREALLAFSLVPPSVP